MCIRDSVRRVPNRSCVACRTVRPKRDLLRIVRSPDGTVGIDETGRAAGRGAYVCRSDACLDRAISSGALGRALSTRLPDDVRLALAGVSATINTDDQTNMTTPNTEGGARGQE